MPRTVILFVLLIAGPALLAPSRCAADDTGIGQADAREVRALIEELGAATHAEREQATRRLLELGEPARAMLERARDSDDPEVRLRAGAILQDLDRGIRPEWPDEVVALVRGFDRLTGRQRAEGITRLTQDLGVGAAPFLLTRMRSDNKQDAERAIVCLISLGQAHGWQRVLPLLRDPENPYQARVLAAAAAAEGNLEDMTRALRNPHLAESHRPALLTAAVTRIQESLTQTNALQIAAHVRALAATVPGDSRFLYLEAEVLAAQGNEEDAAALRRRALDTTPDQEAPHYVAGTLLGELGRSDLAALEWEKILAIPPTHEVYDMNAYLRLGAICAKRGEFTRAADLFERVVDLYTEARKESTSIGLAGGSVDTLQEQVKALRQRAAARRADEGARPFEVEVEVHVKGGDVEAMRRALAETDHVFAITVQPEGFRLLEEAPSALAFDPEKGQILVLLNGKPCTEAIAYRPPERLSRIGFHLLDTSYIYELEAETGAMKQVQKYEKDYTLRIKLGTELEGIQKVRLSLDGKPAADSVLADGIDVDYLPRECTFRLRGVMPSGQEEDHSLTLSLGRPAKKRIRADDEPDQGPVSPEARE